MDFRFDDEQLALRDAVRAFCADHFDLETVATREGKPADEGTWNALGEMGVFDLLGGFGAVEAALVLEQLGAHLATGPLLWSTIAAPLVPGSRRITGVEATPGPVVVAHAAESDVLLVVHVDRVEQCEPADGAPEFGEPFDPLTPTGVYAEPPTGAVVGGPEDARRLRLTGTVLAAAMLIGGAQGALDVAARYALEREQFGVPIGSFQAVKHLLADMYVRVEHARAATYAAAAIADDERAGDAEKAVAVAKLLAGEAGIANGRTAVQVLGGMGFTWEMLPHYFLKRAWQLEQTFGSGDVHARALADGLAAAWT